MPRPKNKKELLDLSKSNFTKLMKLVESYSESEQHEEFKPGTMNRNIRDVLAHLHEWHLMMKDWHEIGEKGEKPDIPAKGYTWKTVPQLNREIWKKHSATSLSDTKAMLKDSYDQIINIIERHSDEELFEKKRYKWTGSTSLGSYLISASSSHYDWGFKLIKKGKKI